jgi:hypothetical protein
MLSHLHRLFRAEFEDDYEGDVLYRMVQKSGPTSHPRLQSCISVEGGHFECLSKIIFIFVLVDKYLKEQT